MFRYVLWRGMAVGGRMDCELKTEMEPEMKLKTEMDCGLNSEMVCELNCVIDRLSSSAFTADALKNLDGCGNKRKQSEEMRKLIDSLRYSLR